MPRFIPLIREKPDRLVNTKAYRDVKTQHKQSGTRTYQAWSNMRARCNPNTTSVRDKKYYIDRGIKVCARWNSFENFLADMGHVPDGLTLDRINNDGNYEPGNCRWTDRFTQMNNTIRSK